MKPITFYAIKKGDVSIVKYELHFDEDNHMSIKTDSLVFGEMGTEIILRELLSGAGYWTLVDVPDDIRDRLKQALGLMSL